MRIRMSTITSVLALLLGMCVALAAQSSIVLQSGIGQPITFSGQGSGTGTVGMTLGSCAGSSCTLSGAASMGANPTASDTFTLTSSANSILLTPTTSGEYYDPYLPSEYPDPNNPTNGEGGWVRTQGFAVTTSAPPLLTISGAFNGDSGTVLIGNLDLSGFETREWSGDLVRIQEATFTAELNQINWVLQNGASQ